MPEKPEPKGNSLSAVQALLGKSKTSGKQTLLDFYYFYLYKFHTVPTTIFDLVNGICYLMRMECKE